MGFLIFIGFVAFLIWLFTRNSGKNPQPNTTNLNQQWVDFIAAYHSLASTPAEKALIMKMLTDLQAQGMPWPQQLIQHAAEPWTMEPTAHAQTVTAQAATTAQQLASVSQQAAAMPVPEPPRSKDLDSTSVLLYFGAFLFVAAAGLFVAFGGANGTLRMATVLVVALAFYSGGLWIHTNKPKLKAAGLTFVGIGIMLAPLVGVAAYAYLFKGQAGAVWFTTSVFCIALYGHALRTLRHPLLEYILIGTFVSLFESAISIIHGPVYYYGWMLAACGLLLQAWSIARHWSPELAKSSDTSSHVLLPVALLASLYMAPEFGVLQLGVSFMLAALFYALHAWQASGDDRATSAVGAHILLIAGAGAFAYGWHQEVIHVAWILVAFVALQTILTLALRPSRLARNAASVGFIAAVVAAFFAASEPAVILVAIGLLVFSAAVTWLRQQRVDAYTVMSMALLTVPFIYAYLFSYPYLGTSHVTTLVGSTVLLQLVLVYAIDKSRFRTVDWLLAYRALVITGMLLAFVFASFTGAALSFGVGLASAVIGLAVYRRDKEAYWLNVSSVLVTLPLLATWSEAHVFLAAVVVATLWHIALSLVYRLETSRWLGTGAWLLLPVAIAHDVYSLHQAAWYASSYVVVTAGLMLARSVSLKRLGKLHGTLAELERRLKSDSWSYVYGYVLAAVVAYGASLGAGRFAPAMVAAILGCLVYILGVSIERKPELLGVLPLLAQLGLWGTYRSTDLTAYALLSLGIAVAAFALTFLNKSKSAQSIRYVSLATMYITPALVSLGSTWVMPTGLLVAGAATLYVAWTRPQSERELAGGVVLLAVLWLLAYNGVTNIQAHTHIIALFFGLYAYWRKQLGDSESSHSYIVAMLMTATVPLVLQSLAGVAGGLYGVWLILDQIAIMLLGMALRDGFVIRWGLYVAIGAVLYQLRDLGWAMVAVLAIFLIGLALYRLQKSDSSNQPPKT